MTRTPEACVGDLTEKAKEILEEFDLHIINDITCQDECRKCVAGVEHIPALECCYIGWPQELAAGIHGGSVSPIFFNEQEAFTWLMENETKLRIQFPQDGNSPVAMLQGKHVVCFDCTNQIFIPLYRENVGQYQQHCHVCGICLVAPDTKFWPELFSKDVCPVCKE